MRQGNAVRFESPDTSAGVPRRRLFERFTADMADGANAIVLSAPAGSGKSVALRQWEKQRRTAGDLVAVVNAAQVEPTGDLAAEVIRSLRSANRHDEQPKVGSLSAAAPTTVPSQRLAHEVAAVAAPSRPVSIIIDDAHALRSKPSLAQLADLLAAAQPAMRIVIAARYTPVRALPKLILDGAACEYRAADLAFDRHEAQELLLATDVTLTDPDLDLLLDRTQGWAAGLRLAAMALMHSPDPTSFVASFAGDDHAVADYLVAEVLSSLPSDVVDLLLAVSVADVVNVDLAGALSGRTDAGAILADLEAGNALVHRASADPDGYELHPLLRTYMRAEARRRDGKRHLSGHTVAAKWFERAGQLHRAVHHSAQAEDWARVERLITTYGTRLLMTDGPDSVTALLATLPPSVQGRPPIALAAALTATARHNFPAARLDLAAIDPPESVPPPYQAAVDALATANTPPQEHDPDTRAERVRRLCTTAETDPELAPLSRLARGVDARARGDFDLAMSEATDVASIARHQGYDHLLVEALGTMCAASLLRGDLADAEGFANEAHRVGTNRVWDDKPWLAIPELTLAFFEWLHGRDENAATHAASAATAADSQTSHIVTAMATSLVHVTSDHEQRRYEETPSRTRKLTNIWSALPTTGVALTAWYQLLSALRARDIGWAGFVVNQATLHLPDTADLPVFSAALHAHQGRHRDAMRDLDPVASADASFVCPISAVAARMLMADLADHKGQLSRSHSALMRALELARPSEMLRVVLTAAPSAQRLLIRDRGRFGDQELFVEQILSRADDLSPSAGSDPTMSAILTERELDILRDLPSLLSLRDIAEAHVVSLNTVKTHLKAVYRKLGASNRREAVNHARELGLL